MIYIIAVLILIETLPAVSSAVYRSPRMIEGLLDLQPISPDKGVEAFKVYQHMPDLVTKSPILAILTRSPLYAKLA